MQAEFARVAGEHGLPYLDMLFPFINGASAPCGKIDGEHLSPFGNEVAAREVFAALRAKGWL